MDAGILAAQLVGGAGGLCRVLVAHSTWVRPSFQTLSVAAPAGDAPPATIVLAPQQASSPPFPSGASASPHPLDHEAAC